MLFVYNANPAVTLPDQNRVLRGLAREDLFTVVSDQVLTDTARWADVVLPATTFLEHYDIARSYGSVNLQLVQPVIEPVGDSRPNVELFSALARRLGVELSASLDTDPEALLHVAGALPAQLRDGLLQHGTVSAQPVQFGDVFPRTPGGKVDLFPAALDESAPDGLYTYREDDAGAGPLILLSPASGKTINSTLGELRPRVGRAADPSARRRGSRHPARRRRARVQRSRRNPVPGRAERRHEAGNRRPPQGIVAAQHAERLNRQRPGIRFADGHRRRRLLQRRAGRGHAGGDRHVRRTGYRALGPRRHARTAYTDPG